MLPHLAHKAQQYHLRFHNFYINTRKKNQNKTENGKDFQLVNDYLNTHTHTQEEYSGGEMEWQIMGYAYQAAAHAPHFFLLSFIIQTNLLLHIIFFFVAAFKYFMASPSCRRRRALFARMKTLSNFVQRITRACVHYGILGCEKMKMMKTWWRRRRRGQQRRQCKSHTEYGFMKTQHQRKAIFRQKSCFYVF